MPDQVWHDDNGCISSIAYQRLNNCQQQQNKNINPATAHTLCASQTNMLEEAHGICVLAGAFSKTATAQRNTCDYAALIAPTDLS
jgi:hypothetical protein